MQTVKTSTDDLLAGIRSWVEIESHTYDVDGVNRLMSRAASDFEAAGARVARLPGKNGLGDHLVIDAPWNGNGPGILVLCHLDTVHPKGTLAADLSFRIDGDRAYGPGIYDMKGGAHLAFAALRELIGEPAAGRLPVRLLYTSDEEIGSPTSRELIEQMAGGAKYVLVTEPARDGGKIVVARKGVGRYVLTARGRPAHAGARHEDGRSAIREIARHVLALEAMTDYARGLTFNVGQIKGGTADNVVPAFCQASVDVRIAAATDGETIDGMFRSLKPVDPDVKLEVEGEINRPPYERNPGVDALFSHAKGIAAKIGFELIGTSTGGGSDGNFTAHKVPTLDGLGVDGNGAHTLEEHLLVSSLQPRLALMKGLMSSLS